MKQKKEKKEWTAERVFDVICGVILGAAALWFSFQIIMGILY